MPTVPIESLPPEDEPEWIFPYQGMDVGDSFFVPTLRTSWMIYMIDTTSKKLGYRMKSYPTTCDGVLGVRSWRIN